MPNATAAAFTAANVAIAIEETITTPTPGFGHGRVANVAAAVVFILTTF